MNISSFPFSYREEEVYFYLPFSIGTVALSFISLIFCLFRLRMWGTPFLALVLYSIFIMHGTGISVSVMKNQMHLQVEWKGKGSNDPQIGFYVQQGVMWKEEGSCCVERPYNESCLWIASAVGECSSALTSKPSTILRVALAICFAKIPSQCRLQVLRVQWRRLQVWNALLMKTAFV